ncbi:uncharacterized protein B0H64DRAFT_157418 [Chaetomium fimeti]|uniref:Uncharacterized protein n=1 Tax=Chaetomium fimeti TaxID=1854472 RepID=A0AAE0HG01_9PEZI|nr:hypothetical protein B0H64DRAFT_157418 [Chaetomium fimeti]
MVLWISVCLWSEVPVWFSGVLLRQFWPLRWAGLLEKPPPLFMELSPHLEPGSYSKSTSSCHLTSLLAPNMTWKSRVQQLASLGIHYSTDI